MRKDRLIWNKNFTTASTMINTTIFKSAFILLLVQLSRAMPADISSAEEKPEGIDGPLVHSPKPTPTNTGDHYDQRQNGTKNFRIHVDGVLLVVAPAEALLLAGDLDPSSFIGNFGNEGDGESSKPGILTPPAVDAPNKPWSTEETQKPAKQKSRHSHKLWLSSLFGPLLRSVVPKGGEKLR
ncbi:uncharacterized protein LOC105685373 [Athalia rosae]|uniref:uncharacterized protein LOC105685373 n=1 Tax=Athalia rosae TaxID=37344 RepID=UPI00062579BB|nr:uncharacterized protein LOC105685373 [Athalia rosae]